MKKNKKDLELHNKDTGSSEVQIAQLTKKIEYLSKHLSKNKKDKHTVSMSQWTKTVGITN